jgi:hypothetical protein
MANESPRQILPPAPPRETRIIRGWTHFQRVGLTTGTISTVLIAALVSGLTQASCYPIVKTYGYAIAGFGFSGLIAALGLVFAMFGLSGRRIAAFSIVLAALMFVGAGLSGIENLRRAANVCFFGPKEEQAAVYLMEFPLEFLFAKMKGWH